MIGYATVKLVGRLDFSFVDLIYLLTRRSACRGCSGLEVCKLADWILIWPVEVKHGQLVYQIVLEYIQGGRGDEGTYQ